MESEEISTLASVLSPAAIAAEAGRLAKSSGVPEATIRAVTDFASEPETFDTDSDIAASQAALRSNRHIDDVWADALLLAKAYSPSQVSNCCTGSAPTWPAQAHNSVEPLLSRGGLLRNSGRGPTTALDPTRRQQSILGPKLLFGPGPLRQR